MASPKTSHGAIRPQDQARRRRGEIWSPWIFCRSHARSLQLSQFHSYLQLHVKHCMLLDTYRIIIFREPHLGRRTASYLCRGGKYLITREVQSCTHETRWGVKCCTVSWSKNWGHPRILSSWKQIFRTGRRWTSSFMVALWSLLRAHHTRRCFYCSSGQKRSGFVLRCATKQGIWGVNNIKCNSFDHRWRTCVSLCDRWLWGIY